MSSVWNWREGAAQNKPARNPQRTELFNGLRTPTNHARHINVIGQAQGQADAHRRDSIKRGGI